MKDDFYIGWSNENPPTYSKVARRFFALSLLFLLGVSVLFSFSERGYIDSYFEYGTLTELSGQIVTEPIVGLRVVEDGEIKTIPLVGFGKFGAEESIQQMEKEIKGKYFHTCLR